MKWTDVLFQYVCPSLGVILSIVMYAAPVGDLKECLQKGHLGSLNPVPWAIMAGSCLGWIAYAYYARDPFILAPNVVGILVSLWLNMGAAKLQYLERQQRPEVNDGHPEAPEGASLDDSTADDHRDEPDGLILREGDMGLMVPQESLLLGIVSLWLLLLVLIGWVGITSGHETSTVGILANMNVVFFYAAPLQVMNEVMNDHCSASIHLPTMVMNWFNTSFWMLYGLAISDPVVYVPNGIGLLLGIMQGVLCCLYPRTPVSVAGVDMDPLLPTASGHGEYDPDEQVGEMA